MIQVFLEGNDISQYVQGNNLTVTQAKADVGQVLLNSIPEIVGIDTEGFWNPLNPASVFFGLNDYSVYTLIILIEGANVFEGSVHSITVNTDSTVTVGLQTKLQALLNRNIIYSTQDALLNPAQVFMEVCSLYKIPYDPVTTGRSSSIYTLNSVVIASDVLTPDTSILSYLEMLAQTGIASIYSIGNYLYFSVYEEGDIENAIYTLENTSDSDTFYILDRPTISSIDKDIPTGYSVTYVDTIISANDQTFEFGLQTNSFSIDGGSGALIRIITTQSAVWIGEAWLSYLNRADIRLEMQVHTDLTKEVLIGYPIIIDMNDNTINRKYIITELTITDNVSTLLVGTGYGN